MEYIISFLTNSNLYAATFGASIGGLFTLLGIKLQTRHQEVQIQKQEANLVNAILVSIFLEARVFMKMHERAFQVATSIEEKEVFYLHCPPTEIYSTIYKANSHLLGKITNDDLRSCIIRFYIISGLLLALLSENNSLLTLYNQITPDADHAERHGRPFEPCVTRSNMLKQQLTGCADSIKATSAMLQKDFEMLGRLMGTEGIRSENALPQSSG